MIVYQNKHIIEHKVEKTGKKKSQSSHGFWTHERPAVKLVVCDKTLHCTFTICMKPYSGVQQVLSLVLSSLWVLYTCQVVRNKHQQQEQTATTIVLHQSLSDTAITYVHLIVFKVSKTFIFNENEKYGLIFQM